MSVLKLLELLNCNFSCFLTCLQHLHTLCLELDSRIPKLGQGSVSLSYRDLGHMSEDRVCYPINLPANYTSLYFVIFGHVRCLPHDQGPWIRTT